MSAYRLNSEGVVVRNSDAATIPVDLSNPDYLAFLASGETPDPYIAPAPTQDELDAIAAKSDALIEQVAGMTPAQVLSFVQQNFSGLNAQQQKFLFVCGVAASFVARRL